METRTKYLLFLVLAGGSIFLFNLGGRDLWEPDETRYAAIARDMKEPGDWILPHFNREIYAEKPPLFFWLINLSTFFLGGDNEFANRLPSALAGLTALFITFLFGERLFNLRAGFLSAMVLATCMLFPQLSRWMMLDSLVTLFLLLSLFYFYLGYEDGGGRRKYYLLAGLFMALGVLTKGPIGYLSLPIFLIFALIQREIKKFWNRNLLWGCLLSLILVLIWWAPACWIGGRDYIYWLLFKQAVGTYVEGGRHFHPKPFYFYFVRFPLEFFPWVVFLPTAIFWGLRKEFGKKKEFLFLFLWFIFIFLFFTLSRGKKDNYLLPLYPAAAIMVGSLWDYGCEIKGEKKGFILGFLLIIFLNLIALVLFLLRVPQKVYPEWAIYSLWVSFFVSYLFAGLSLSFLLFVKGKKKGSFICLVVTLIIFHLHFSYSLPSKFNVQKSVKAFSERVLKRMEPGDDLKTYSLKSNGLLYYSKKSYIESIQGKDRFLEIVHSPQRVFIVIYPKALNDLEKKTGIEFHPVEQARIGHWDYVLISNH